MRVQITDIKSSVKKGLWCQCLVVFSFCRQVVKDVKVKARYHHLIANSFVEVRKVQNAKEFLSLSKGFNLIMLHQLKEIVLNLWRENYFKLNLFF